MCHFKSVVFSIQCLLCADTGDTLDGVLVGDWVDMQQTGMLEKGRGGSVRICIIFSISDIPKSLFLPLPLPLALDLDLHIYSIPQRHLLPIETLFLRNPLHPLRQTLRPTPPSSPPLFLISRPNPKPPNHYPPPILLPTTSPISISISIPTSPPLPPQKQPRVTCCLFPCPRNRFATMASPIRTEREPYGKRRKGAV